MARNKHPFIKLQGTIAGITFVDSRAYGAHSRLARGTHKEATLNAACRANTEAAPLVNGTASALHREWKACYHPFTGGQLWPRMLSRLFKAPSTEPEDLLSSLEGLELNESYPLSRVVPVVPRMEATCRKAALLIDMQTQAPFFSRAVPADCYCYELRVFWLDGLLKRCESDAMETDWIRKEEPPAQYELRFAKPGWARYYLVALKVRAGKEQRSIESFPAMAVGVVQSGAC